MWDIYYDEVEYSERTEKLDQSGHPAYSVPRTIKVREVSGGKDYVINKEGIGIKYTKEYQIPFLIHVNDKINGKLILQVEGVKDVFGKLHFYIARVE